MSNVSLPDHRTELSGHTLSFPNDEAAMKLLYLAFRNAGVHWRRSIEWTAAMTQFAILFGDRFAVSAS